MILRKELDSRIGILCKRDSVKNSKVVEVSGEIEDIIYAHPQDYIFRGPSTFQEKEYYAFHVVESPKRIKNLKEYMYAAPLNLEQVLVFNDAYVNYRGIKERISRWFSNDHNDDWELKSKGGIPYRRIYEDYFKDNVLDNEDIFPEIYDISLKRYDIYQKNDFLRMLDKIGSKK